MTKNLTLFLCAMLLSAVGFAQNTVVVTDATLEANTTYNWTADNEYVLDGLVYLEEGGILNIEAGTVIRGTQQAQITTGDNASALIITRDAQIFARGTADAPVIFTAVGDDISDNTDLTAADRGEWGGLIILGDAPIAFSAEENGIEGIDSDEMRARYGGNEPEDNSGVLNYVSIRHGGFALSSGNEINGLTLGGVGSGTEIDFVEVYANADDGIEWFGGTVDVKHASVAFCGDDGMDYDLGWRGKGQFWFVIQEPSNPDGTGRSGEHDGASPDGATPFSQPTIYNATYVGIGNGATAQDGDASDPLAFSVVLRDNAGGFYNNSIFTGFNSAAIGIEQRSDDTPDSYDRFIANELDLSNNIFEDFGGGSTGSDLFFVIDPDEMSLAAPSAILVDSLMDDNTIGATGIASIGRMPNGMLDPRIDASGAALSGGVPNADDEFFSQVSYRGAFGNTANWLEGWTALSDNGYLGDLVEEQDNSSDNCITVTDADLVADSTYNWTSNNCYNLDGLVFLEDGGTLNIEAGTVVRGLGTDDISTGDNTSALIITRDAQIFALGTAEEPIIFTAGDDDLDDATDFTANDRGEWGGLIVLGDAPIAFSAEENGIEGIDSDEERARYGGNEPEDNSGVINYVSIRHGGFPLSAGNEINGLTLGGVGSGTEIDFVEVFANSDDGIEWFGGTVDVKHAAVAFCGDDGMDYDLGWRGRGQFWFVIQEPTNPDGTGRAGEHDGASPDGATPFSQPIIYNATYIGIGNGATAPDGDASDPLAFSVIFRDNAGGYYWNSLFTGYNSAAIAIEQRSDDTPDAYDRFLAGDLDLRNNLFEDFGAGTTASDLFLVVDPDEAAIDGPTAIFADSLSADNEIGTSGIAGISRTTDGMLDPRIDAEGAALTGGVPNTEDEFFSQVTYRGAFGNTANWLEGWTALSDNGYLGDLVEEQDNSASNCIVVSDADLVADSTYTWTSNNCYNLDGLVFLEEGGTLNIEAGTVVRGLNADAISTGDNTSALIITRDAQIFARGTADQPIIFTAADDDLSSSTDLTAMDRGEWGGLIILGDAPIAFSADENGIEGIDSDEERARYGGNEPEDNSGVINYISIRHGGFPLSAGNEINGLTLGGVGSDTEIDFVEVFANSDDGIEWFGGTVRVDHAAVSYCGDDGMDYDLGWLGGGQFWFVLQGPNDPDGTGRAGEHDGASPDGATPFSQPTIYNATYIGIGNGETAQDGDASDALAFSVLFRDNAGGFYNNSIFTDYNSAAIGIEQRDDDTPDSFDRLMAGELQFNNNLFFDFGAGSDSTDIWVAVDPDETLLPDATDMVAANFAANGNRIISADLNDIDNRDDDGGNIDPRPNQFGAASFGAPDAEEGFESTGYFGAFAPADGGLNTPSWLSGWTALDAAAITTDIVNGIGEVEQNGFLLDAPVPNPTNGLTRINFELPRTSEVTITIIDLMGRPLARRVREYSAGQQSEIIDVANLPNGNYFIMLDAQGSRLMQKMVVNK